MQNMIIDFCENVKLHKEHKQITLAEALDGTRSGRWKPQVEAVQRVKDDPDAYRELKAQVLPTLHYNGIFQIGEGLVNETFVESSGLFHFDVDKLTQAQMERFGEIIRAMPDCVFLYKSPSGKGYKGAIRILPTLVRNDDDFKRVFKHFEAFFLERGIVLDKQCKDVRRACFASYDPDLYYNPNATVHLTPPPPILADRPKIETPVEGRNPLMEAQLFKQLDRLFTNVAEGERHGLRFNAGRLAGGYVARGWVDEDKVRDILIQLSDRIADKGVTSPSEIQTICDGIENGKLSPVGVNGEVAFGGNGAKVAESQKSQDGVPTPNSTFEPEPLRAPMPKAEPYPVKALGDILGAAATALHETIKAPLTICCQSVLASASLAAQSHYDVMLPWGEKKPLSLYLLTVAESGERKSGVDDVVLGAAKMQERQDMEVFKEAQEKYETELAEWKDAIKKSSAKTKNQPAEKPQAPIMPLRFISEPTIEGLFKLMATAQPSLGLFSDEGGLLIGGHALNSDNALKTMARWCKLWDGAGFDRVRGGDGSDVLYGRRLAMHQLAQPEVMTQLLGDRLANGQGLLARCLVAWPESTIGYRHINEFEQPRDRKEIKKLFAKLKTLTEAEPRTCKNKQELNPVDLPLNDDAKQLAKTAVNQFETLMQAGNDLAELRDRASKAVENACRIAGVLTVVEDGLSARVIDAERFSRALVIVQWYLKETLRIRGAAVVPQSVCDAESLSKWLDEHGYRMFRSRQVLNKGPSHLRNKKRLDDAIKVLVDNGYLVPNDPSCIVDGVSTRKSWSILFVA